MNIWGTTGVIWVLFTSAFGTITFFRFALKGLNDDRRQADRGRAEEHLDIVRATEEKFLSGMVK
jgi:hypothetical protein